MIGHPEIFKAYDIRGIYPGEIDEPTARQIGRGFVAYLGATRIAVGRDMRLSAPSIAAAFIEGARAQGADVVDYGMIATDMLYFAVARDGHDGGALSAAGIPRTGACGLPKAQRTGAGRRTSPATFARNRARPRGERSA